MRQVDGSAWLQDFILAAIHEGILDAFEAWRTMAAYRACAIAAGSDPREMRFRWEFVVLEGAC